VLARNLQTARRRIRRGRRSFVEVPGEAMITSHLGPRDRQFVMIGAEFARLNRAPSSSEPPRRKPTLKVGRLPDAMAGVGGHGATVEAAAQQDADRHVARKCRRIDSLKAPSMHSTRRVKLRELCRLLDREAPVANRLRDGGRIKGEW